MNGRVRSMPGKESRFSRPFARWAMIVACMAPLVCARTTVAEPRTTQRQPVKRSWRPPPPKVDGWTQRYFVDKVATPRLSYEEKARGFVLYSKPSYMSLVYDSSVPHDDDKAGELACRASLGEYESVTLAIYSLREVKSITVSVGNLSLSGGDEIIDASQMQIHVAENQYVRLHARPNPKEYVYMPRYLYPQTDVAVDLHAGQSAWFWITIQVPEDAQPGTYRGKATVNVGGRDEAALPIRVEVLPIQLDTLNGYPTGYYARYENPEPSWTAEDRINYMAACGSSTVQLLINDDAFPNIWKDGQGQIHVDITGSNYDEMMSAYANGGFAARPQMTISGRIYNRIKALGYTPNTSDYDPTSPYNAAYLEVLRQLKTYGDQQGWPVPFISPLDEAPSRAATSPEHFNMVPIHLSLLKNAGFGTELNHFLAYNRTSWQNACLPYLDIMTMIYSTNGGPQSRPSWDITVAYAQQHGLKLQTYNTLQPGGVEPTSWRFMGGWLYRTWGEDLDGNLFYVYDAPHTHPDNDLADFRGDTGGDSFRAWRRPDPSLGLTGGPAIDTVALREGLDDLRYIVTLERLIAEGNASANPAAQQAAADAAVVLQGLIDSFDFSNAPHLTEPIYGTAQSELMGQGTRDGLPTASGEYLYRNGWSVEDYDKARDVLSSQIIKLQDFLATIR